MTKLLEFNYSIYIDSTPTKVWEAITIPEITKQFWLHTNVSSWEKKASWFHFNVDGVMKLVGEVTDIIPEKLLLVSWSDVNNVDDSSNVKIEISPVAQHYVNLTITHKDFREDSKMFEEIKIGWPMVLSSLKSYLETGKPLLTW